MTLVKATLIASFAAVLLKGAAPHYLVTTYGGFTPPYSNPIARQRYFSSTVGLAYDGNGSLYWAAINGTSIDIRRLNADGTDTARGPGLIPSMLGGPVYDIIGMMADAQNNLYVGVNVGNNVTVPLTGYIFKVTPTGDTSRIVTGSVGNTGLGIDCFTMDPAGNFYTLEENSPPTIGNGSGFYSSLVLYPPSGVGTTVLANGTQFNGPISSAAVVNSSLYFYTFLNQTTLQQSNLQLTSITQVYTSPTKTPGVLSPTPARDGTLYIAENTLIRQFANGGAQTVAGSGAPGSSGDGGSANQATLGTTRLTVNPVTKDVAFYDYYSGTIRVVSGSARSIQTVAGTSHVTGDNGPVILAHLQSGGLATDGGGNLYVFQSDSARIRKINPQGVITTIAGTGAGSSTGDGGKAVQASIAGYGAGAIAADKSGNVYFIGTDTRLRKIDTGGTITTIAGGGTGTIGPTAQATSVSLVSGSDSPTSLAADASGNVYMGIGRKIWKLDSGGRLSSFAGTGGTGTPSDGSPAATAAIGKAISLAVDPAGNLYFGDGDNFVVRKIDTRGALTLVAGIPTAAVSGAPVTPGPAKKTGLIPPSVLATDASGNFYIADSSGFSDQILMVDPAGNLTPIAGSVIPAANFTANDGGDALQAYFQHSAGMTVDAAGNIYVLDAAQRPPGGDAVLRKLSVFNPGAPLPFLAQGGVVSAGASIPAIGAVSGNGIATLYGANFIATPHSLQASDLVNGQLPTNLAGVCVSFGNTPAAMLGVYPNQINVQAPALPPGPVTVQVTVNCGSASAAKSNLAGVTMQPASPEFFSFLPDPLNGNPIAAYNAGTGVAIGPQNLLPGLSTAAVRSGDLVEAYGTGWGVTDPPFNTGVIPGSAATLTSTFSLTLGNVPVPPANIAYLGVAPCCAGLYQLDFTVPDGVPNGNQPLILNVAGWPSPSTAYLAIQQ